MQMDDMQQCPNCGYMNDSSHAVCANCNTPLTAYGGQVTGEPFDDGKLAEQVARLEDRPAAVTAIVVFDTLFALLWPFAYVLGGFLNARTPNVEGPGNAITAAFSLLGPLLSMLVLLPFGIALLVLAWHTWNQRPIAWGLNVATLALFGLLCLRAFPGLKFWLFLPATVVLALFWLRSDTKAWYGMM
jgi:hypothetical protein